MSNQKQQDWDDWDVNKSASSAESEESEPNNTLNQPPKGEGFWRRLADGDFGLAKTYWLYGVLVGIIVNIFSNAIASVNALILLFLAYAIYLVPVLIGTWNAANKYKGLRLWAILAKTAAIFNGILLSITVLVLVGLLDWRSYYRTDNSREKSGNAQPLHERTYTQRKQPEYSTSRSSREQQNYSYGNAQEEASKCCDYSTGLSFSENENRIEAKVEDGGDEEINDSGTIRRAQTMLAQLGYSVGPIDGIIGQKTRSAIEEFEKNITRPQAGILTREIVNELYARVLSSADKERTRSIGSARAPGYSENQYITAECEFKRIMTDQDYINCGRNPPARY